MSAFDKFYFKIVQRIKIEKEVKMGRRCYIRDNIYIGKGTAINGENIIVGDIKIGKYCTFAKRVVMRSSNHNYHFPYVLGRLPKLYFKREFSLPSVSKGPIIIGNDVSVPGLLSQKTCNRMKLLAMCLLII